jgi:tetratricopeptide (TPR) repeat protein
MKKILLLSCLLSGWALAMSQSPVESILKARALTASGKPDQAISILNTAIIQTRDSRLFTERAGANILKGDYSSAIADYNEANKIAAACGEYGLARIYALKGDAGTALYHLELNLKSEFKKSEKEIMLDPAFSTIDSRADWRSFWKKDWYSATEKSISEIEYYISAGKVDQSLETLTELKKITDSPEDLLYAQSLVNLAEGKFPEVINGINGYLSSDQANEKFLRILAKAQTGYNDPAGASNTYTKLLDSGVADAELFLQRAECYQKTGETVKALEDINKYLEIYPGDRNALSLAGKAEVKSGDNLTALKYFSDNLKLHPNDPECYIDRANSYFMSKSWDMAINDYSMSLDLKPGNSDVWLNKGIALLNSGKVNDACHDFRKAFSLGNKKVTDYISRNCIK